MKWDCKGFQCGVFAYTSVSTPFCCLLDLVERVTHTNSFSPMP